MNDRPTPETDAAEMPIDRIDTVASRPSCVVISDVARRLERERDEARDAAEKAKAYKRVLKEDNAKLRRELDELNKRLIEVCQYGVVCTIEREDLHKELDEAREELASERALADRLAWTLGTYDGGSSSKSYTAWKEARK